MIPELNVVEWIIVGWIALNLAFVAVLPFVGFRRNRGSSETNSNRRNGRSRNEKRREAQV